METFDIEKAVAYMEHYINTYRNQPCWKEYSDWTFIEDMLYAIGHSVSDNYRFAGGFENFKAALVKEGHIETKENMND